MVELRKLYSRAKYFSSPPEIFEYDNTAEITVTEVSASPKVLASFTRETSITNCRFTYEYLLGAEGKITTNTLTLKLQYSLNGGTTWVDSGGTAITAYKPVWVNVPGYTDPRFNADFYGDVYDVLNNVSAINWRLIAYVSAGTGYLRVIRFRLSVFP